jgi:ribonuclease HII
MQEIRYVKAVNTFSDYEHSLNRKAILFAGVDEAGRGPLAGPVVAAAVVFARGSKIEGIEDSKKLSAQQRDSLRNRILEKAEAVGIGMAGPREIDELNILQASILAMHRAIDALAVRPELLLVDGNRFHHPSIAFKTIIKGDSQHFTIAAASIVAKTERDRILVAFEEEYPGYGFSRHKGYPTKAHVQAIVRLGYSPIHRKSFVVKSLSAQESLHFQVL